MLHLLHALGFASLTFLLMVFLGHLVYHNYTSWLTRQWFNRKLSKERYIADMVFITKRIFLVSLVTSVLVFGIAL